VEWDRRQVKGVGGRIQCKKHARTYVNAKMILAETIRGIGGSWGGRIEVDRVNSSMIYSIHCKNLCTCHSVPQPSTTKEKKKREKKRLSLVIAKKFISTYIPKFDTYK
jgi:hypothetical protein